MDFLEAKRKRILEKITPMCEAFGIREYDYEINKDTSSEVLVLNGQRIGCTCNSEEAVIDEIIGFLFVKRYCRHRSNNISPAELSRVRRYWI